MKRCTKCGKEKDESEFYVDSRSKKVPKGRTPSCKLCVNAANRAWAAANPEKVAARSKAWREKNPDKLSANSRAWQLRNPKQAKDIAYKTRYNLDFDSLWQAQNGNCALCHEPMINEGIEPDSVCVDHDRKCCPGKKSCGKCVRGLIHRKCNMILGYVKDDPEVLQGLADYLDRWNARGAS